MAISQDREESIFPKSSSQVKQETGIKDLAERLWRVHPREIQDLGITRQEFYEREITRLIESLSQGPSR